MTEQEGKKKSLPNDAMSSGITSSQICEQEKVSIVQTRPSKSGVFLVASC